MKIFEFIRSMFKDKEDGSISRSKKLLGFNSSESTDEAYKHLRTILLNTTKTERCPVFSAVSAKDKDEASVTASNLAISFSQLGKNVLLIDGDMRDPKIAALFGISEGLGLSDLLVMTENGVFDLSGAALPSGLDGLDILPAGKIPTNPTELLASKSFEELIEKARSVYDTVVLSLPAVCDFADACVVTEQVTGYVFAIRSGRTNGRAARAAVEKLTSNGGKILGTVLTDVGRIAGKI